MVSISSSQESIWFSISITGFDFGFIARPSPSFSSLQKQSLASREIARQHGVTKPLSLAGPSEIDLLRTNKLDKVLVDAGLLHEQVSRSSNHVEFCSYVFQYFLTDKRKSTVDI
ncbi:hypothetical protein L6452_42958 [Arctium lappa]|uniref:Uncharacterized protein n=1 Tax=Arctium lappa TaxID=4217 RepID=A0ACB8XJ27_ARCLA|nr:hypothetical protein L6452_42958 [Arctium lappa]